MLEKQHRKLRLFYKKRYKLHGCIPKLPHEVNTITSFWEWNALLVLALILKSIRTRGFNGRERWVSSFKFMFSQIISFESNCFLVLCLRQIYWDLLLYIQFCILPIANCNLNSLSICIIFFGSNMLFFFFRKMLMDA